MKKNCSILSPLLFFVIIAAAQEKPVSTPFAANNYGKPARIPGAIQAENFDEGPEGVAYHNVGPVDSVDPKVRVRVDGANYRKTDAEIEIGWGINMLATLREGEWYNYTVQVDETAFYDIDIEVASWEQGFQAGAFRIEFDGVDKTGAIFPPNTGRWRDFGNVTIPEIKLEKGVHVMRVFIVKGYNNLNLDCFRFRNTISKPFVFEIARIPGLVEAENFDEGPEGVAFHNIVADENNNIKDESIVRGLNYRKTPVKIKKGWGTTMISSIKEGEWYNYTVQVDKEGVYEVEILASGLLNGADAGCIRLEFNGKDKTGNIIMPYSPEWYLPKPVKFKGIKLKRGVYNMKVVNVKGSDILNLDSFRFNEVL